LDKIAGLLGAVAALGTVTSTEAAPLPPPSEVLHANSYADLLEPIPNAGAVLKAMDEQDGVGRGEPTVQLVQYHHHHHSHTVVVTRHRHYRHHHHHHHHHHHSHY
jgi:hypothetical protein